VERTGLANEHQTWWMFRRTFQKLDDLQYPSASSIHFLRLSSRASMNILRSSVFVPLGRGSLFWSTFSCSACCSAESVCGYCHFANATIFLSNVNFQDFCFRERAYNIRIHSTTSGARNSSRTHSHYPPLSKNEYRLAQQSRRLWYNSGHAMRGLLQDRY